MSHLGMGVLINMLGADEDAAKARSRVIGKKIKSIYLDDTDDGKLVLRFSTFDLEIYDDGRSCCEHRYLTCDDELKHFKGATLLDVEIAAGPETDDGESGNMSETQFLRIITTNGTLTVCTHNEHNGYYGGFYMKAEIKETR